MKKAYNTAFKNYLWQRIWNNFKKKTRFFSFKKKLRHCRFDGIAAALQFLLRSLGEMDQKVH